MALSNLVDFVGDINFGKVCRAVTLGVLLSCGGSEEDLKLIERSQQPLKKAIADSNRKDTFPPYVEMGIVGNYPFGTEPTITINVDDISPVLKSNIQIAPGLTRDQTREKNTVAERYSSNLDRIELYEN
ncbi:MAG TPA: hypothetical protein VJI32_01015, partial [Candidatus Nanoarchaeia archaeon]|nr:hypothetical protein [Candidatus Nanoarchaeia archaeon]